VKSLICFVVCILAFGCLYAQNNSGTIQGTVTDPSGAVVPGAAIIVRNMDTGLTVSTQTTDAGVFSAPNLPPGRYSVSVEAKGMRRFTQEGVTIRTLTTTTVDVKTDVGEVTNAVNVNGDALQLETATSDLGVNVEPSLVQNLPLEVSGTIRNPVQFITLIPGFVGSVGNDPGSNQSDDFKVNGGQEGGTDILVDGLSISLVSPNTQWNKGVSTEAIQEFKVLQSNFSAEFGESGDGIVNLTVKSGTNKLHGTVYDFLRNRALDANSWTNNHAGAKKSVDTQNDFGASLGGPVYIPHLYHGKDKTFFYFNYEGFRFRNGGSSVSTLVPEAFRNSDFSALCSSYDASGICNAPADSPNTQLYDPTTHNAIPHNILTNDPNFTASSVITKAFAFLPATNGSLQNNVINKSLSSTSANLFDIKIDHSLSDKQHFSVGFDFDNTNTGGTSSLGPIFGSHTPQNTRYVRFNHNYTFTNSLVNQFLAGFSRRFRSEVSNGLNAGYPTQIGLTGVLDTTFPCIKFNGSPYQDNFNNCGASQFADNVYQFADSVSWVHGKHMFKFGGEARLLQFNERRLTQSSGEFDFDSAETSFNGSGGDPVASAMFGLVHQGVLNYGSTKGIRYKDFAMYAQDAYRLTPKLTLNYGLRYDLDIPATESQNRFSMVDPSVPNPGAGGIPGGYTYFGSGAGRNGKTRPQDTFTKAFGPRLGFAYSINDKTVLRGGYGIFYEPLKEGSFADQDSLGFFNLETLTTASGAPFQIDNGFPHLLPANGPFTPEGQNGNGGVIYVPANSGRPGDIQSWHLDVQRQIANNLMATVSYVGSKGTHLPALNIIPNQVDPKYLALGADLNQPVSCLMDASCPAAIAAGVTLPYPSFTGNINQALRPFPQYGNFNQEDNSFSPDRTGNSTYHAMQAQLNKRFAQGLSFLVSYTISKNITDADSAGPGVSGFIGTNSFIGQNSYDRRAEKAVSQLDTPQSLVASFFYELPIGQGKPYLSNPGAASRIVSGWSVSGVLSYHSGQPTEVYGPCSGNSADNVLFAGGNFTGICRVNVVPGVKQTNVGSGFNPDTTSFFNAAAFSLPADFTFANEGRSLPHARTFGGKNEDFTIGKKTRIAESASVDFKASFFNAFNRHIFQAPGGFATPLGTPFQTVGSAGCSGPFACGFGAVTSASGPRAIQFGLSITY
jgi:Carboxypeptidase regulatory-like domain/TonB dependent receptor